MTTSVEWPTSPFSKVVWRYAQIGADGSDPDTNPDWKAAVGRKFTLRPSITGRAAYKAGTPEARTIELSDVLCMIDANGELKTTDGLDVYILATDDPDLSVQGWTWFVAEVPTIRFSAITGATTDLTTFVIAPAVDATKTWVERIPELVDLISNAVGSSLAIGTVETLPAGSTVTATITGSYPNQYLNLGIPGSADINGLAEKATTLGVVRYTDATEARPVGYGAIYWIGELEPVNSAVGDIWRQS